MTGGIHRLPAPAGSLIDRASRVGFSFEGRGYAGFAGDTIASALAANGVWTLSRSFKYHRPRGVLTMAGLDANTLVQVGDEPNVPADRRPIREGMEVRGQNYSGSLARDRLRWIELFAGFLPVGFYYKAFYRPKGAWKYWEPFIRRLAGLGKVNIRAHHGYFDKDYLFADVAVVGGGPAGMSAALEAAKGGADVVLVDDGAALGGSLGYARFGDGGARGRSLAQELAAAVRAQANIRVLTDAACTGLFADNWLSVIRGNRLHKLRAAACVVAAGSLEQPAVFRNNDLPGVMLGSAAQRLIRLYGVKPGKSAVVLSANGDGYGVALDLLEAGVEVRAVVDLRERVPPEGAAAEAHQRGVRVITGSAVALARAGDGGHRLGGVNVARITGEGRCAPEHIAIDCDLLCLSAGYSPAAQLLHHAGARFRYNAGSRMFEPSTLPAHVFAAGSVAGCYDLDAVLADGRRAGWEAARDAGFPGGAEPVRPSFRGGDDVTHPWPIFPHPEGKDFVDFDEDLQVRDLVDGAADGYDDIELLKRYSTVGMGPSQGRHSAVAAVRILSRETGRDIATMGVTTQRPPYVPEKMGHLAGRSFDPARRTAMHHRHEELGAAFMPAGIWWRPAFYGPPGRREQAIRDEANNVRRNVGLIDVSTLGGLDIRGPDAAEFLNRMYTSTFSKLQVGRLRYALMTEQAGAIIDDGVACRLHEEHYYVTATTSGVDAVYRLMLFWNAQWRLDVDVANVTAAYAGVNIAGPRSREVLAGVCGDVDLSPGAFPYLGVRTGTVAGVPCRILRVGFVGELGYEIHMPAHAGEHVWDALMEAGRPAGIRPFGVEAQRVLRLEKGHIIIGQDTDGLTHPHEADMGWAIAKAKPFFLGGRSIGIQAARAGDGTGRKLVGFELEDPSAPVPEECHLVIRGADIAGRVTSAVRSPTLGRVVGLAYVAADQAGAGSGFEIRVQGGRLVRAKVVPIPFYDPANKRQEM